MNIKLPSLQFNGLEWEVKELGERALLLNSSKSENMLEHINQAYQLLESMDIEEVSDVVPSYNSIAIIFKSAIHSNTLFLESILKTATEEAIIAKPSIVSIPVCYDLGMDWEAVTTHTGLIRDEIIKLHVEPTYRVAMMGFVPGFVFLSGLQSNLSVPRKEVPRKQVPAGSVGIGGDQTGVYSLESPGGWQIIGRTPLSFFDVHNDPPSVLKAGDQITFKVISEKEYNSWDHGAK